MELIFVVAKLFQYILVAPVWWLASMIAGIFYPFEGDKKHDALALVIATSIFMGIGALLIIWLQE